MNPEPQSQTFQTAGSNAPKPAEVEAEAPVVDEDDKFVPVEVEDVAELLLTCLRDRDTVLSRVIQESMSLKCEPASEPHANPSSLTPKPLP